MKHTFRPPNVRGLVARDKEKHRRALYRATQEGIDQATIGAQRRVRSKIRAVGLGGLANAVGKTSSFQQRKTPVKPWGAIYVKGGDQSRAGQALESYSRGAVIRARRRNWLAFATNAVPRTIGRRRTTPELFKKAGMVTRIGQLHFVQVKPNLAFLMLRNVSLHPRTHQAKRLGPRPTRTRVAVKEVVAFVLIKVTRRAMRFDKDREIAKAAREVPTRIGFLLDRILTKG